MVLSAYTLGTVHATVHPVLRCHQLQHELHEPVLVVPEVPNVEALDTAVCWCVLWLTCKACQYGTHHTQAERAWQRTSSVSASSMQGHDTVLCTDSSC